MRITSESPESGDGAIQELRKMCDEVLSEVGKDPASKDTKQQPRSGEIGDSCAGRI